MMPVVYSIPGMDKVVVKPDLKYSHVDEPHLLMDVYAPPHPGKGERRPAVLFIHGSVPAGSPAKSVTNRSRAARPNMGMHPAPTRRFQIPSLPRGGGRRPALMPPEGRYEDE